MEVASGELVKRLEENRDERLNILCSVFGGFYGLLKIRIRETDTNAVFCHLGQRQSNSVKLTVGQGRRYSLLCSTSEDSTLSRWSRRYSCQCYKGQAPLEDPGRTVRFGV